MKKLFYISDTHDDSFSAQYETKAKPQKRNALFNDLYDDEEEHELEEDDDNVVAGLYILKE